MTRQRLGERLAPFLLPLLLLAVWQAATAGGFVARNVLPSPVAVAAAFAKLAGNGQLAEHLSVSVGRALSGFAVGGLVGFALGLANGLSRRSETVLDTSVQMIRNIPHLALIPLVIVWFGIGEEAKLFLVALGVFFPVYVNTFHGIRSVDPQLVEMARVYGVSRLELFARVVFPGALPSILVGVRYALGIMWLTLIVAETISASSGLGYMAMQAREFMQLDVVILAILIYALLGKLADSLVRILERAALSWHPGYRR
ncbi:aliphatic sulfonate ABC transporter permease SsuC [Aureimonas pseudogalii]|uniref:Sulfonate transport system permease protein n=1 Tax=Aureimonas pseudogalii TaxID=1744844 RepID=A0A7W6EBH6_9HYPH|nr:aliphatic sulfonate ABC transporter permease SsuC [Aureimonas pseudogalii]MBB3996986.1 sulfonate transport system permease protein [Aureimonas pseudogalii]